MTLRDCQGHPLTGASAASLAPYETALRQFHCYIEDPVASVDHALAESEGFVMAHVFKAYLHLLGTEPLALPVARACHAEANRLPANARERGHVAAVGHLVAGRWRDAGRALEDVAIDHPLDLLALQAGHVVDFYIGDSRMLRDRVARALPAWDRERPGYHVVLGLHAFGLEETGDFARAEERGREAVAMEPRDGWAQHAVAHVLEMQGRQADGIAWMRGNAEAWSKDSFFAVHNWWHLALYHLDLGEIDAVLALFDGPIHGQSSTLVLDLIDASALLWRLSLRGVDVGERWHAVADHWQPLADAGTYAFNDAHAVMAFVGAGRPEAIRRVLRAQDEAMNAVSDNARFLGEVGRPVTEAIVAFGEGDFARTIERLRPVRNIAHRFGGSHAQRDLLDLTLIEAAFRANEAALAKALVAERLAVKPTSPFNRELARRAKIDQGVVTLN